MRAGLPADLQEIAESGGGELRHLPAAALDDGVGGDSMRADRSIVPEIGSAHGRGLHTPWGGRGRNRVAAGGAGSEILLSGRRNGTVADTSLPRLTRVLGEQIAESVRLPPPVHTKRRTFGRVRLPGKATAIVGMRRAGKTTFLHQIRRGRIERGAAMEQTPCLSFEDERLAGLDASHLGALVNEYHRRFPVSPGAAAAVTWCFDEIQVVPGWERFVRRLIDSGQAEVFVTGSSAALLSREIATALRGRAWQVLIHPFSFEEALRHQGNIDTFAIGLSRTDRESARR